MGELARLRRHGRGQHSLLPLSIGSLTHRLRPPAGEPEGALLLFHGRGTDENDLFPLLEVLDPERRLLGATARGPLALPPGGWHWYAVRQIGYPDPETFHSTYPLLSGWVDAILEEHGVPPERTALGGFSMGAVMSYALGLGSDRPSPGAILAFSGFLPTVEGFELDFGRCPGLQVSIGHGTHDPVIGVEWGRSAKERLEEAGAEVVYRESPMTHAIDPGFLDELRPWLADAPVRKDPEA